MKAFGYGTGSFETAELLQYNNISHLAVASTDEGIALRKGGLTANIIVLNPEERDLSALFEYNLEPEIYNFRMLDAVIKFTKRTSILNFNVHIKLDTGMHRLGFMEHEVDKLISTIRLNANLHIYSLFSHLAASDEPEFDDFTESQIELFNNICTKIETSLGYSCNRHIQNTAGIERFSHYKFDMVRLGIGLYGISENVQSKLIPVHTFKSSIIQTKIIPKGETIGYSRAGHAKNKMKIGIIPAGYADGIPRSLGNGNGKFVVNGVLVPTIGSICMDMTSIDLTNVDANEGDEVIIFGKENHVGRLAKSAKTIPYELITGVSSRVKRMYIKE